MYRRIGADWKWSDRLDWSDGRWASYCSDPCLSTLRTTVDGEIAGFTELRMSPCDPDLDSIDRGARRDANNGLDVEIVYFGIVPEFTGRGLGGWLLSVACRIAWNVPRCRRVWLHACDDDSPAAIPNYQARRFTEFARADSECAAYTA